jgi:HEAT repeat protein
MCALAAAFFSVSAGVQGETPQAVPAVTPQKIAVLCARLSSPNSDVRFKARRELVGIGKPAVPALIETFRSENYDTREAASYALGEIGEPAVPELIAALNDKDYHVVEYAAKTLGRIGPPAREAVPHLIARMLKARGRFDPVALEGVNALGAIGLSGKNAETGMTVEDILLLELHHLEAKVRAAAARALIRTNPEPTRALPHLIKLLEDEDDNVRRCAAATVRSFGLKAA